MPALAVDGSVIDPRETPIVKVVRDNADAVVNISTERIVLLRENPVWGNYGNELDYFFGEFFGLQRPIRTQRYKLNSVGSGVIVDKSGLIVTNAHVIHMASNIFIVLNDGTSVEGQVMYENPKDDLAIIRIDPPKDLKEVKMADVDDIMVGETVVAIGNPLGLENSVSAGIISGKNRSFQSSRGDIITEGLLQTDAPINPGNSGGALLNLNGELVGINVAVVQHSQSIGFAIPINKVKEAMEGHQRNQQFAVRQRNLRVPFATPSPADPIPPQEQEKWDPFAEMDRMREEMDNIFQNMFSQKGTQGKMGVYNTDIFYSPEIDLEESKEGYIIKIDISGLNKDKVEIDINNYAITITGESSQKTQETGPHGSFESHSFGSFLKTVPLPENADPGGLKTETKDDLLILYLPKRS